MISVLHSWRSRFLAFVVPRASWYHHPNRECVAPSGRWNGPPLVGGRLVNDQHRVRQASLRCQIVQKRLDVRVTIERGQADSDGEGVLAQAGRAVRPRRPRPAASTRATTSAICSGVSEMSTAG